MPDQKETPAWKAPVKHHQEAGSIQCGFPAAAESHNPPGEQDPILLSNFLAQTEALAIRQNTERSSLRTVSRRSSGRAARAAYIRGNFSRQQADELVFLSKAAPQVLDALIAGYERKIFTHGVIWNVNSYDRWGVELGKQPAKTILPELTPGEEAL